MNKSTTLLIPLSILLLIGCNSSPAPTTTTPPPETSTTTPPNTVVNTVTPTNFFKSGDISFSTPKEIEVLSQKQKDAIIEGVNKNIEDPQYKMTWSSIESLIRFYDDGQIINGKYKGQTLLMYTEICDGPCFAPKIDRFAYDKTNQKLTLLYKHSSTSGNSFSAGYSQYFTDETEDSELKGLTLPSEIKLPNSDKHITIDEYGRDEIFDLDGQQLPKFTSKFEDPEYGTVYYNESKDDLQAIGCFYVKSPDGTVSKYKYDPKFFIPQDQGSDGKGFKNLTITWQNGEPSTDLANNYVFNDSGCGIGGQCYTIENAKENELNLVGKAANGIDLYEPKDPKNHKTLKGLFETYTNIGGSTPNLSFDDYMKMHPVLFWKDPMNRWSVILNSAVKPAVECGKPVIYIYPKTTTDVNVKVGISKLTETIPAYPRTGWTVRAEPNGQLYNYSDKTNYPYLYWEGESYGTQSADKGFVIERSKISNFLNEALPKLGLNTQEAKDFKDFWVEKMLANKEPYFFISFIGTKDFNKVAPLTITPAPDTLLRVFMYYKPLNNFINVPKQELSAPMRRGYSVVEWGGTSSIPWKK